MFIKIFIYCFIITLIIGADILLGFILYYLFTELIKAFKNKDNVEVFFSIFSLNFLALITLFINYIMIRGITLIWLD